VKFSTRSEYGVRVLITLAREAGDGPVSLAGIARREKLPHAYLEQLVRDLRRAGLVAATRGQAGGYALARDPSEITMAEVMRALDGPLLQMACAGTATAEACDRPVPCSVHELYQRVYEALDGTLTTTNLADVLATAGGPPYPRSVRLQRAKSAAAARSQ
jgi:Rrf2 family protein